jgi:para-nitrobenzyl esterase
MNGRRKPFFELAAVIFTISLFLLAPSLAGAWNNNLVVKTEYGKLKGALSSDRTTLIWKGVPYAAPPVGDLRWKASQDPQPWHGVRKAIDPAPKCTQLYTTDDWTRTGAVDPDSSEDCLYVDIYRPHHPGKLPVYVWIHGGSNNFGSAREYPAADLAVRSDVVVVVVQYRLGPLGWFYHPALQKGVDPLSDSGNFGTLDHAQALRWIRENIEAFGGDPHNVIVAGESAGAHNTMNLVISPVGKGLFNRAMSESGGMAPVTADSGRTAANDYIEKLIRFKENVDAATATARRIAMENDGTLESYLRQAAAGDFFLALIKYGSVPTFPIIMDGKVMPLGGWIPAIQSGNYNKMPIILGCNEYELKAFMPLYGSVVKLYGAPSTLPTYSWSDLFTSVRNNNTPKFEDILKTQFDWDLYDKSGYFGSRQWKAKNVDSIAHEMAEVQDDVYAYYFKWGGIGSGPYPFDHIYGAGHAAEIAFFGIGADKGLFNLPFVPANEKGREKLKNAMMSYLSNFVRTGNPNYPFFFPPWGKWGWSHHSGLPTWKEWSNASGDPKAIVFDADLNHAKITMMNEEVTFTSAEDERQAWVIAQDPANQWLADNVTKLFLWQPPW